MRYSAPMNLNVPLTPHLEQYVRDQLATGRFQSASEVVYAALQLLEERSESGVTWLKQELDKGLSSRPSEPASKEFWNSLRERLRAKSVPDHEA
jgi:antitoxin ParD1/3/4